MARVYSKTSYRSEELYSWVKVGTDKTLKLSFDIRSNSSVVSSHANSRMVVAEFANTFSSFLSKKKFTDITTVAGDFDDSLSLHSVFNMFMEMDRNQFDSMMGICTESRKTGNARTNHITLVKGKLDRSLGGELVGLGSWFFKDGRTYTFQQVLDDFVESRDGQNIRDTLVSMNEQWQFEVLNASMLEKMRKVNHEIYEMMHPFISSGYFQNMSISESIAKIRNYVSKMQVLLQEFTSNAGEFGEMLELAQSHDVDEVESSAQKLKGFRLNLKQKLKELNK